MLNGSLYADNCTSFAFYQDFLVFTVGSSSMYDKMYVIDLVLDHKN